MDRTSPRFVLSPGALLAVLAFAASAGIHVAVARMSVEGASGPVGICSMLVFFGLLVRMRRLSPSLEAAFYGVALVLGLLWTGAVHAYAAVANSSAFPLVDRWLAAADLSLGVNWTALVGWFDARPVLARCLDYAYAALWPQFLLLILAAAGRRDFRAVNLIASSVAIAFVFGNIVCVVAPAAGILSLQDCRFATLDFHGTVPGMEHFFALRDGTRRLVTFSDIRGVLTFPSYHAFGAMLAVMVAARQPVLLWFFVPLNAAMCVSAVTVGGHYVVDVLAGGALALVSWWAAHAAERFRFPALPTLIPQGTDPSVRGGQLLKAMAALVCVIWLGALASAEGSALKQADAPAEPTALIGH